ncbi:MAG: hypothetical protein ABSA41_17210 [Terriglobia bacterium]|jgi:hypothetical protein
MSEIEKVIGLIFQSGTDFLQAVKQVEGRLSRIREIRDRGGQLGSWFCLSYECPQYIYRLALVLCTIAGLSALSGGVLEIFNVRRLTSLQLFFDDYWLKIVALGLLLLLITYVDGITRVPVWALSCLPTRWLPSVLESPAWFNVRQYSNVLEKPKPLVIAQIGVDRLADFALVQLVSGSYRTEHFADKPTDLSTDERANAALFGCLLEQEHYVRRWGMREWRPFYAAVAGAREGEVSVFAPNFLQAARREARDYYAIIRELVNPHLTIARQEPLPDSGAVAEDVMKAIDLLNAMYGGSAANLARTSRTGNHVDLRLAFERVEQFPHFSGEGMRPQFLKIAVRWDVWPGVATGNFIYPFSSSLAALFLGREAVVTLREVDQFSFKSTEERRIVREAMRQTVSTVDRRLRTVDRKDYQAFYAELQAKSGHPVEWELAEHVDFVLWSEAYELGRHDGFDNWRVDENKFVVRKK